MPTSHGYEIHVGHRRGDILVAKRTLRSVSVWVGVCVRVTYTRIDYTRVYIYG